MASSTHAMLGPSKAKQWMHCPPSALLNAKIADRMPEEPSPFAREGTLAHAVSEEKLRFRILKEINEFAFNALIEQHLKDYGTDKMPAGMDKYTDDYVDIVAQEYYQACKACPDALLLVESKLDYSEYVPGGWGTGDVVIVSDNLLTVIDLKYGQGVAVSAVDNPQAKCYGLGALIAFGQLFRFDMVKNMIVQIRVPDGISSELISRSDLIHWAETELAPAASLAAVGAGEFHAGEWCKFCNAKAICKENARHIMEIGPYLFDAPDVLTDSDLAKLLPFLDVAEQWIKDVRPYVLKQALAGSQFRGYKLVQGRKPPRKWRNEEEAASQLLRAGRKPEEIYSEPKLRSVAEIERLLKKTEFNAIMSEQYYQEDGKPVLVPESDKREEYSTAESDFKEMLN